MRKNELPVALPLLMMSLSDGELSARAENRAFRRPRPSLANLG